MHRQIQALFIVMPQNFVLTVTTPEATENSTEQPWEPPTHSPTKAMPSFTIAISAIIPSFSISKSIRSDDGASQSLIQHIYLLAPPFKNRINSERRILQPFPALTALIFPSRMYFKYVGLEIFRYSIASSVVKTLFLSFKDNGHLRLHWFALVLINLKQIKCQISNILALWKTPPNFPLQKGNPAFGGTTSLWPLAQRAACPGGKKGGGEGFKRVISNS